eukprot:1674561-Pyramimonas_sp.AAC.1
MHSHAYTKPSMAPPPTCLYLPLEEASEPTAAVSTLLVIVYLFLSQCVDGGECPENDEPGLEGV